MGNDTTSWQARTVEDAAGTTQEAVAASWVKAPRDAQRPRALITVLCPRIESSSRLGKVGSHPMPQPMPQPTSHRHRATPARPATARCH
jgi:hypothetical protein